MNSIFTEPVCAGSLLLLILVFHSVDVCGAMLPDHDRWRTLRTIYDSTDIAASPTDSALAHRLRNTTGRRYAMDISIGAGAGSGVKGFSGTSSLLVRTPVGLVSVSVSTLEEFASLFDDPLYRVSTVYLSTARYIRHEDFILLLGAGLGYAFGRTRDNERESFKTVGATINGWIYPLTSNPIFGGIALQVHANGFAWYTSLGLALRIPQ